MEGLRFIRRRQVLLGAITLDMFAVLFGGAVALLPAIAEERLDVGSIGYGWLRAAPGIGAVVSGRLLAVRPVRRQVGTTLLVAVAVFGAATVVLGVTRSYVLAFVALLVLSGADAVSVFIRATIVPLATPDEMRGRVMAVENVFIGASNELGAFESGVAGALLGVGPAVWLGGLLTMGVVGVASFVFPDLRDIDRFEDLEGGLHARSRGGDAGGQRGPGGPRRRRHTVLMRRLVGADSLRFSVGARVESRAAGGRAAGRRAERVPWCRPVTETVLGSPMTRRRWADCGSPSRA